MVFDINKQLITRKHIVVEQRCTYLWFPTKFNISIVSEHLQTKPKLFSVDTLGIATASTTGFETLLNWGYTLYIPNNLMEVTVRISFENGQSSDITFQLIETDEISPIDNTDSPQYNNHYEDLLANLNLPSFDRLKPALLDSNPKRSILRRLLLDFNHLVKQKGTKSTIEKLLYFIGYNKEQIRVELETHTNEYNETVKTGDYFVLIDNWSDGAADGLTKLNSKNLPLRIIRDVDYEDNLLYVISIANQYFTAIEQDIVFFGISYSSNIPMFQSVSSITHQIYKIDPHWFRKSIDIDVYHKYNGAKQTNNYIVRNSKQENSEVIRTELKYISNGFNGFKVPLFHNIRLIDSDKNVSHEETLDYKKVFGGYLRYDIRFEPNLFSSVTVKIKNKEISLVNLTIQLTKEQIQNGFVSFNTITTQIGSYSIEVTFHDKYNNREQFEYSYTLKDNIDLLDFIIHSSAVFDWNRYNQLGVDIDAPSLSFVYDTLHTPILKMQNVPSDLSTYFNEKQDVFDRYSVSQDNLTKHARFFTLPEINKLLNVDEVTKTLPLGALSNWIELVAVPVGEDLYIKLWNTETSEYELVAMIPENAELISRHSIIENMFATKVMNVNDNTSGTVTNVDYILFIGKQMGLELNEQMLPVFVIDEYGIPINIIHSHNYVRHRLPVNHSWNIFGANYPTTDIHTVQTIFDGITQFKNQPLDIGDVILIRPDSNFITEQTDVLWRVVDSFTGQVVMETRDYALKYRITYPSTFDVIYILTIGETQFKKEQKSFFSSFSKFYGTINS